MFPSDISHAFKYSHPEYDCDSTDMSYSSVPKLREPFFSSREPQIFNQPFPRDMSYYSKDSSFYSKDTTFTTRDSIPFARDQRRKGGLCKDEDTLDPGVSKRMFIEDPYERYRSKTTSFMEKKPEGYHSNVNNTVNFSNVNSLAHFQRKSPLMNMQLHGLKLEEENHEEDFEDCFGNGKNSKGLKNLSIRVREFVIKHKETSYKEMAEQLLKEIKRGGKHAIDNAKEEQNIKRRIYDALNVLVATEIFKKKGKTVYYDGKSNVMGHDLMNKRALFDKEELLAKIQEKKELLQLKQKSLQAILTKNLAIKNLLHRNYVMSAKTSETPEKFEFPFLLLPMNSNSLTLKMNKPKNKLGVFSKTPLNVLGDMDVLIKLNMHKVERNMIEKWFPKDVIHYLPDGSDSEDQ